MKGRILGTLFALPFFGVGVWMLWSVGSDFADAFEMRGWAPVEASLTSAGYTTSSGDDSDTYEAYAAYTYNYLGQTFTGDRVGLSSGGDNIGDYQRDTGNYLSGMMSRGQSITVWVNPDNPAESIIDPSLRWGLVGFKSIFLLVFGGVGLGLLIAVWRSPKKRDKNLPEYRELPWRVNPAWDGAPIRSGSKLSMWGMWAFAALWNLISAPTPFIAYREIVDSDNYLALAALLFPLVGILLISWAIKLTREWRRFGATPVTLDPFPGAIGGHVGGTIDLNLPYDSSYRFMMTLTSIHSYISGSGDDRTRKENARWQEESVAHAESTGTGTRLVFRFDVPEGLNESDADQSDDSYNLWRLNLSAELPGTDLDRDFEIPVYATGETSKHISDAQIERASAARDTHYDTRIRDLVQVTNDGLSKSLVYPAGRNAVSNLMGFTIGAVFAATGYFLAVQEGHALFGTVFGSIGAIVAIAAFYMLCKSLHVVKQGNVIRSTRKIFGIPVRTREMRASDFYRFEVDSNLSSQKGNKHVKHYTVTAIDHEANEVRLGEGFKGKSAGDAAVRFLSQELGLVEVTDKSRHGLNTSLPLTRTAPEA
ncbi:MAG: DUF3592 domain-containing protein [Woeseiaceae bacterium]|nr:DUF3592 domain-containing protein [Woeseiaceae bacterium]